VRRAVRGADAGHDSLDSRGHRLAHVGRARRDQPQSPVRDPVTGALKVAEGVAEGDPRVVIHDAHAEDPSYAFALSRLSQADTRLSPMGIFRNVDKPSYDRLLVEQIEGAKAKARGDDDALTSLLRGSDAWTVG